MEYKYIYIFYYRGKYKDLPYEHNQKIDYTKRKRNSIIDKVLEAGYNVMLRSMKDDDKNDFLLIAIDEYKFEQR